MQQLINQAHFKLPGDGVVTARELLEAGRDRLLGGGARDRLLAGVLGACAGEPAGPPDAPPAASTHPSAVAFLNVHPALTILAAAILGLVVYR